MSRIWTGYVSKVFLVKMSWETYIYTYITQNLLIMTIYIKTHKWLGLNTYILQMQQLVHTTMPRYHLQRPLKKMTLFPESRLPAGQATRILVQDWMANTFTQLQFTWSNMKNCSETMVLPPILTLGFQNICRSLYEVSGTLDNLFPLKLRHSGSQKFNWISPNGLKICGGDLDQF